jgi:serine/threonine protein kinase
MGLPDRYQIVSTLGEGGMGIVYLANDLFLKRQVAIKCLRSDRPDNAMTWDQLIHRQVREAQAAGSLQHPNIVAIYDIVPNGNSPAIVMEYLPGKSLSQMIQPGKPLDPQFAVHLLKQCASALDYGHARNIVHRDIKPSNIMIDEAGRVRLTDFGIAKNLGSNTDLTQGAAIGTLEYMSPEQLDGKVTDGRSDQYSLAVMAYQLITGFKAYEAQTLRAFCQMVFEQYPIPASQRLQRLPVEVDSVLRRALAKVSSDRYPTCCDFISDLARALERPSFQQVSAQAEAKPDSSAEARRSFTAETQPQPAAPDSPPSPQPKPKSRRMQRIVAVAVGAGVALAVSGVFIRYWMGRNPERPQDSSSTQQSRSSKTPQLDTRRQPTDNSTNEASVSANRLPVDQSQQELAAPAIVDFAASKSKVNLGESVELRWNVRNATGVSIRGVGGSLPAVGTRTIHPEESTVFLLEAQGGRGPLQRTLTVDVIRTPPPEIRGFTASKKSVQSGQPSVLQWDVSGATSVSIEGLGPMMPGQINRPIWPTASRGYVLTATGPGGKVSQSVNVEVTIPPGQNVARKKQGRKLLKIRKDMNIHAVPP